MQPTPPHPPAARFARLIAALCAAVAARLERPGKPGLAGPFIIAIYTRLQRIAGRITRLAARVAAGTLTPPRHRPAGSRLTARSKKPAGIQLPRGCGWLSRLVPTACGGTQLQALLADPEIEALIAAAPQIGRTLRPLCHLLGVRVLPQSLRRPPQAAPPPAAPPPASRPLAPPRPAGAGRPPPAEPPRTPLSHKPPASWIARPACGPPVPA